MSESGTIPVLSVVALLADLPKSGLVRGQVGTVVEQLGPTDYEVEFSDETGQAYAIVAVPVSQLMQLHHSPVSNVA